MRFIPQTRADWGRFILLPFKTYVAVAFPLAYLFPDIDSRHGWNLSLSAVLPGYVVCFFVLLIGGLAERACHLKQEGNVSLMFAAASLIVYLGPWFRI